jgi:hypothetical protein
VAEKRFGQLLTTFPEVLQSVRHESPTAICADQQERKQLHDEGHQAAAAGSRTTCLMLSLSSFAELVLTK